MHDYEHDVCELSMLQATLPLAHHTHSRAHTLVLCSSPQILSLFPPLILKNLSTFQESTTCSSQSSDSVYNPLSYTDLPIQPTIGKGDTAHITLSTRSDMMPVQGRYDMRELVRLELTNHSHKEYVVTEGVARDYGNGQWAVYLNEAIFIDSLFTGFYGS